MYTVLYLYLFFVFLLVHSLEIICCISMSHAVAGQPMAWSKTLQIRIFPNVNGRNEQEAYFRNRSALGGGVRLLSSIAGVGNRRPAGQMRPASKNIWPVRSFEPEKKKQLFLKIGLPVSKMLFIFKCNFPEQKNFNQSKCYFHLDTKHARCSVNAQHAKTN